MKHYAIVPARNGSKSIKDKNLSKIGKKETLVDTALRLAKESRLFEKIILTTDIPFYLDEKIEGVHIKQRPKALATDEALMEDVVIDVIKAFDISPNSYIWLLQPTTPFRKLMHFRKIQDKILREENVKNIISVEEVGAGHPNRMYTAKNGKLFKLRNTNFLNKQELPKVYIRNGAFYVCRVDAFLGGDYFAAKPISFIEMSKTESINIDCEFDLMIARVLANA